jgi:hypothetical protein
MLQHQQRQGQDQREHNHPDAHPWRAHRLRMLDPLERLHRNQHRTAADEQRLRHAGQRLGLAMAVTVIVVGGRRA